ncbi:MAG TPA: hypothetical protein PKL15_17625, partial [Saprospiraceae bacterium]|nr:hypothetical protein [Saprospiraceae bacterium]
MRTFAVLLFTLGCIPFLWAQTRGFNYQAVIRDQNGILLVNQQKEIEFNFFNKKNKQICTQTILVTTNAYGVANTVIDLDACGDLGLTDWLEGGIYLRIALEGISFTDKQLLHYVP